MACESLRSSQIASWLKAILDLLAAADFGPVTAAATRELGAPEAGAAFAAAEAVAGTGAAAAVGAFGAEAAAAVSTSFCAGGPAEASISFHWLTALLLVRSGLLRALCLVHGTKTADSIWSMDVRPFGSIARVAWPCWAGRKPEAASNVLGGRGFVLAELGVGLGLRRARLCASCSAAVAADASLASLPS